MILFSMITKHFYPVPVNSVFLNVASYYLQNENLEYLNKGNVYISKTANANINNFKT